MLQRTGRRIDLLGPRVANYPPELKNALRRRTGHPFKNLRYLVYRTRHSPLFFMGSSWTGRKKQEI